MFRKPLIALMAFAIGVLAYGQDADGVYTKVDKNPSPTKTIRPDYPRDLRREGISGLAAVSCIIDEKGDVISAKVIKSSHPGFEKPALEAINRWKFKPAEVGGTPVKVKVTIPFRFNVDD